MSYGTSWSAPHPEGRRVNMQRRNAALNYYYFILLLIGVLLSTVSRRLNPLRRLTARRRAAV